MNLLNKSKTYFLFISVFILLWGCQQQASQKESNSSEKDKKAASDSLEKQTKEAQRPTDRKFDDIARFISGMKSEAGSGLDDLEKTNAWISYSAVSENQWQGINANKLPIMKKWADEELKEVNQEKGLLFYPFSGPDFLHASVFFPEMEEIVMIGLEPIGSMPDLKANPQGVPTYLNRVQQALASVLQFSFFQTLHMAVDLTNKNTMEVDGTLPVILLFMERTNHKILYYEKVAIDPNGKIIPATEIKTAQGKKDSTYYGTRIDFQTANSDKRRSLYYFGVNLSNDAYTGLGGLQQRTDLMKYLNSLNITATYLKSASYLMYKPYFTMIRDLILDKSKYLLQDDSGMPIENVTNGKWDLTFFGVYAGPIPLFANYWQNDMAAAYTKKNYKVKALPFGIGYQYRLGSSNLMLAKKLKK